MGHISHHIDFLNLLTFNPTVFAEQLVLAQRKLLTSAFELMFVPFLGVPNDKKQGPAIKHASKPKPSIASVLTAKLADPALSFAKAMETAEPMFNMLSNEDI